MNITDIINYNVPYNQRNLDSLVEKIRKNSVVPFVGAGLSMLFENVYPSWGDFLKQAFKFFSASLTLSENEFDKNNNEEKANYLFRNIGKATFADYLRETFGDHLLEREICEFTDKPVYLLPLIFNSGLIVTTNYDRVIEKIFSAHSKQLVVAHPGHFEALNRALGDNELLLFKMHGDICEPDTSVILTGEQYDKAYSNPKLRETLKRIITCKTMLFLGCSLINDRYLDYFIDSPLSGTRHFAIIPCEQSLISERRTYLENKYLIQSIIYPNDEHQCVYEILKYIVDSVKLENESSHNQPILNNEWFNMQNFIQIKNLGDRYMPDLNVELEISKTFEALGRSDEFFDYFLNETDKIICELSNLKIPEILKETNIIGETVKSLSITSLDELDVDKILKAIENIRNFLNEHNFKTENEYYCAKKASYSLENYAKIITSKEIKAFNTPFVLLHGEGGVGKSHLIADVITKRINRKQKSILLLGQHFKQEKPSDEILRLLDIKINFEAFLDILNNIAEKEKSRIIIFIDALNEGKGKSIWNAYLPEIVENIKRCPWLGLVASIRTEYVNSLFFEQSKLKNSFVALQHTGFSNLEYEAVKKYFEYYKVTCLDIPLSDQEFKNPLFVRMFCSSFSGQTVNLNEISFTDIYKNYLSRINDEIAGKCNYSKHINVVEKLLDALAEYKYQKNLKNNFMPLDDCIEIITEIENKFNLSSSLLDELISCGLLTQNIFSGGEEYIFVTYEKLEDYFYGKRLVRELEEKGIDEFKRNHCDLVHYPDVLEAFSIVLSESNQLELFELFEADKYNVIEAFCRTLKWRKMRSLKENIRDYINATVLKTESYVFFEQLILIAPKISHALNADSTVKTIMECQMPDRDSFFIPLFDSLFFDDNSVIMQLIDWCLQSKEGYIVNDETIRLTAIMLSTFMISSNRKLRDMTTKALVILLSGHINILIKVMKTFEAIDDPYVTERLYAVAFGCITNATALSEIGELAIYVYNTIFNADIIYPNILIRDYAKSIVEYAKYKTSSAKLSCLQVQPPYKSIFPNIPPDKEIDKFRYDYNSPNFKDYFWSQNIILNSMQVEYDRNGQPGGYGDFGRYIFQSYFSSWENLDYNDLKNIAIKRIFELGYDVEKHGIYDRKFSNGRARNESYERIGKKYQWIALYELAAQVADKYKMKIYTDEYGSSDEMYCKGSFEPNIRDIDPTAMLISSTIKSNKIHKTIYTFPSECCESWINDFKDFPDINKMIHSIHNDETYILLNGQYLWNEKNNIPHNFMDEIRDMWILINSYIVKSDNLQEYISAFADCEVDFMGRWASEPTENFNMFNKEFYWSDVHDFFCNPYYGQDDWTELSRFDNKMICKGKKVLIPTFRYCSERHGDQVEDGLASWYKPCRELFDDLALAYGYGNSMLYDNFGNLICFDSGELLNEDIGFFIKLDSLKDFLKAKGYSIFWTVLSEKRVDEVERSVLGKRKYKMPHLSGYFYFNESGEIVFNSKQFDF